MSLFKKLTNPPGARNHGSAPGVIPQANSSAVQSLGYGSTNGPTIVETRPRSGTDPETCLEVFKSHWAQVWAVMKGLNNNVSSAGVSRSPQESANTVVRYLDHMVLLLMEEEEGDNGAQGPILQFMLEEDILHKLITWSAKQVQHGDRLKLHHLKMFDMIIAQSRQQIFVHKPIIRPMLQLLASCEEHPDKNVEQHLILVLGQLCVALSQNTALLEVLFSASSDQGAAKFLMFSLLIPYIHREGSIGQQARDALLLIMALSARHDHIGQYIAQNSDFCPVLATGLSGLYSSLPRKMNPSVDDWYCIRDEDVSKCTDLIMFLNSLEFCNAVIQVAHTLVAEQLLSFIYNGFLVPVMAPALHQNDIILPEVDSEDDESVLEDDASSMEEVIAATAYLDLFIRRATEPALVRVFVKLVVMEKYDDVSILDSLVSRIQSNSRLCMVTMALFKTLVELNCEDVMFQLVFKFLIPCTHVMVSQRRAVRDLDMYGRTAEKLLALTPNCCKTSGKYAVTSAATAQPMTSQQPPASPRGSISSIPDTPTQKKRRWRGFGKKAEAEEQAQNSRVDTSSTHSLTPPPTPPPERHEGSYFEYLDAACLQVSRCAAACQCWSAPYDGEVPSPDSLVQSNLEDSVTSDTNLSGIESLGDNRVLSDIESENNKQVYVNDNKAKLSDNEAVVKNSTIGAKNSTGECTNQDDLEKDVVDNSVENRDSNAQCSHSEAEPNTEQQTSVTCNSEKQSPVSKSSQPPSNLALSAANKPCDTHPSIKSLQTSYAESSASEADSAISGVSGKSEQQTATETGSRSDSPLNDNFDNADFNSFLLSLKRVQTPVEFSESMEDCLNEIEAIASELKKSEKIRKPVPIKRPVSDLLSPSTEKNLNEALSAITPDVAPSMYGKAGDEGGMQMSKSISMVMISSASDMRMSKSVSLDTMAASTPAKTMVMNAAQAPIFTPTKYNLGTPDIGPFLSTILAKLESMMQNSLYVNLLLTGLVTRLACYPQPLLRSFLLNHTLVFQPTVKSLLQVLGSVKHKVDAYAYTVKDFDVLMSKARQFLAWRESPAVPIATPAASQGRMRSDSNLSIVPGMFREKKKGSSFGDFLRRNLTPQKQKPQQNQPRLQLLETGTGFRYIHRMPSPDDAEVNPIEALKAKNAVYCALVLEEFVKELAALSQEHAVLNVQLVPS